MKKFMLAALLATLPIAVSAAEPGNQWRFPARLAHGGQCRRRLRDHQE
ncbi:MAG: hypothetical protein NVV74_22115 [Magnetospirillum sp.]|nr:hypothetical protein [Magnetospirillum sp.]